MTTEIELTQGETALISDEDADRAREHSWALGGTERNPYAVGYFDGGQHYLHRWLTEAEEGQNVTFRNGNGLDCRRENLVVLDETDFKQSRTYKKGGNALSRYQGVTRTPYGRWRSRIKVRGETTHIGVFDTEEEAALAYLEEAEQRREYVDPTLPHFDLREKS